MKKNGIIFIEDSDYSGHGCIKYKCPNCNKLQKDYNSLDCEEFLENVAPDICCLNCHCDLQIIDDEDGEKFVILIKSKSNQTKLTGKTFLFTGTLTEMTLKEAETAVKENGGKVLSGVSPKLNYLVVGKDGKNNLEKAKKEKTVKIISEKEFMKMLPLINKSQKIEKEIPIEEYETKLKKAKELLNSKDPQGAALLCSDVINADLNGGVEFMILLLKINAYMLRGDALTMMKKFKEAESDFSEVIKLDPDSAEGYFKLFFLCKKQSKSDKSLKYFKKAEEIYIHLIQNDIDVEENYENLYLLYNVSGDKIKAKQCRKDLGAYRKYWGFVAEEFGKAFSQKKLRTGTLTEMTRKEAEAATEKEFMKMLPEVEKPKENSGKSAKAVLKGKLIKKNNDTGKFKTVVIGKQEWMAENLNVEQYRNGDKIPEVKDPSKWHNLKAGAWCYYENKTLNGKTYGKLYNWYAVNDPRGLAPEGWHIPTDEEWSQLSDYLGGVDIAGGKLKATTFWNPPNTGATNSSGFSAFPGGVRYDNGFFNVIGKAGSFWSASEDDIYDAWLRDLIYSNSGVLRNSFNKAFGFSVRCVRD